MFNVQKIDRRKRTTRDTSDVFETWGIQVDTEFLLWRYSAASLPSTCVSVATNGRYDWPLVFGHEFLDMDHNNKMCK